MSTRKPYRAILNRAHGYLAPTGRFVRAGRMPRHAQRAGDMAQAITARYAAIERRWPAMALVFEQPDRTGPPVTNTYQTTHTSLLMTPRLLLRMLVPLRAETLHTVADRTPAQSFGVKAVPMTVAIPSRSQPKNEEHDDVIARIVRRRVREELSSVVNARPASRTSLPAAQVRSEARVSARWPLPARFYRRAATAKGEVSIVSEAARSERAHSSPKTGRGIGAEAIGRPGVDIARITDQVLHALDRRIVTQRERMGVS